MPVDLDLEVGGLFSDITYSASESNRTLLSFVAPETLLLPLLRRLFPDAEIKAFGMKNATAFGFPWALGLLLFFFLLSLFFLLVIYIFMFGTLRDNPECCKLFFNFYLLICCLKKYD